MKIILFAVMLLSSLGSCSSQSSFSEISKEISNQQLKQGIRSGDKDYFHDIRMKLSELGELDFCRGGDTIYLLESYDIENSNFYGRIWNSKEVISYTYNMEGLNFDSISVFSDYTCELIQNWDMEAIRHETKKNSSMTNPLTINGCRVADVGGKLVVDCVQFKEFFLLDSDR